MEESQYVYALCRKYEPCENSDERRIIVGLERRPFLTNSFDLFKTREGKYVARFEEISRVKGYVIGKITDSHEEWKAIRTIPIDDLVDPSEIYSGVN